jgi:hypothetical protein
MRAGTDGCSDPEAVEELAQAVCRRSAIFYASAPRSLLKKAASGDGSAS